MFKYLLAGGIYWALPGTTLALIGAAIFLFVLKIGETLDARHEALIASIDDAADNAAWRAMSKQEQEDWLERSHYR
jgi:hypothetical protein